MRVLFCFILVVFIFLSTGQLRVLRVEILSPEFVRPKGMWAIGFLKGRCWLRLSSSVLSTKAPGCVFVVDYDNGHTLKLAQKLRAVSKTVPHHLSCLLEKFFYTVDSLCLSAYQLTVSRSLLIILIMFPWGGTKSGGILLKLSSH